MSLEISKEMAVKMTVIRTESDEFNCDLLKFKPPRKVQGIGTSFFFQSLSYGDDGFYLQTPFFYSNGMSVSNYNNMRQMRVTFPEWQQSILKNIDSAAQEHLVCPDSAPAHWKKSLEEGRSYKKIPEFDSLFLKLSDHFQAFDLFQNVMECDDLKRGRYIALIHVTGIYLGAHGTTGKLASLQMKVLQLLYEPTAIDKCLILFETKDEKDSVRDSDDVDPDDEPKQKKSRRRGPSDIVQKPKLKRQEAQNDLKKFFNVNNNLDMDSQVPV